MPYVQDMAFLAEHISDNLATTDEGFLVCFNVPIARTGIQEYLGSEIGLDRSDKDYNRVVKVYRLAEDVFDELTLRSFEGKPFTNDHPGEAVTPSNYNLYGKGHLQNIRVKGEHIVADVMAKDSQVIQLIGTKQKRQVSAGYSCEYVPYKDGYRQINIRANHVALVVKGRAGPKVSVKDSVVNKKGVQKPMAMTKKQAQARVLAALSKQTEDADEIAEVMALVLDAEPAPAAKTPVADEGKKSENSLLKTMLGVLFSKDEESKPKDKEETDDEDEEEDNPKKSAEDKALSKRLGKVEKTLDSILQLLTKTEDADGDEDEDETETEDSDDDEETEEKKKEAADAAMKDFMVAMKPIIASLPEKKRKEAKDAIRKQFGKGGAASNYLAIAKIADKKNTQDSQPVDFKALADKIQKDFAPKSRR